MDTCSAVSDAFRVLAVVPASQRFQLCSQSLLDQHHHLLALIRRNPASGFADQIDAGLLPGLTSLEQAELFAARRRIRELEAELAIHQRAAELLKTVVPPKAGSRPSK